jgi:GR25 family glycosyltransferase involved in LPS biosynthesis
MKIAFYTLVFISSYIYSNVIESLDTRITHQNIPINGIDAAFLIRLFEHKDVTPLIHKCEQKRIFINEYNQFNSISLELMTKFCSPSVSPYILTQVLSHLSIYKYCLMHGLDKVLVLEDQAQEMPDSDRFFQSVVEKLRMKWDILYLDADYHDKKTGKYLFPVLSGFPVHKRKLSRNFSKVYARYGTVSYLISKSGMIKLLNHYKNIKEILPLDQEILNIKRLNKFAVNSDVFTNEFTVSECGPPAKTSSSKTLNNHIEGELYKIHPDQLLSYDRFDIIPKYIFAKYFINQYKTEWHIDLYKHHLKNWVGFYNYKPYKLGFDDFYNSFVNLISNIKSNGYSDDYPIKVNELNMPSNGAHRMGTCLALDIPITALAIKDRTHEIYSADAFRDEFRFEEKYLDHMAYEYTNVCKDSYIACLFPLGHAFKDDAIKILNKHGSIIFSKELFLTDSGMLEFIRLVYNGEWWTGSYLDDYKHSRGKVLLTFPSSIGAKVPVTVFIYRANDHEDTTNAKAEFRKLCKIGNDVLHINDTHKQTIFASSSIFNRNSRKFLNTRRLKRQKNFDRLFAAYHSRLEEMNVDFESVCLCKHAAQSALGESDLQQLDIIHSVPLPDGFIDEEFQSSNDSIAALGLEIDEIIFNPENHFFYKGLKFMCDKNELD